MNSVHLQFLVACFVIPGICEPGSTIVNLGDFVWTHTMSVRIATYPNNVHFKRMSVTWKLNKLLLSARLWAKWAGNQS